MIEQTMKVITKELAKMVLKKIPISRALDLLEVSSKNPTELLVINVLREAMNESGQISNAA